MTKKAKIILYTFLSTITIASVSTAVTIMLLKNKNKRTNNSEENNQKQNNDNKNNENNKEPEINDIDPKAIYQNNNLKEVNSDDIFPVVNSNDYYDKLILWLKLPWKLSGIINPFCASSFSLEIIVFFFVLS